MDGIKEILHLSEIKPVIQTYTFKDATAHFLNQFFTPFIVALSLSIVIMIYDNEATDKILISIIQEFFQPNTITATLIFFTFIVSFNIFFQIIFSESKSMNNLFYHLSELLFTVSSIGAGIIIGLTLAIIIELGLAAGLFVLLSGGVFTITIPLIAWLYSLGIKHNFLMDQLYAKVYIIAPPPVINFWFNGIHPIHSAIGVLFIFIGLKLMFSDIWQLPDPACKSTP